MRDEEDRFLRLVLRPQLRYQILEHGARHRVERAERLVHQQHRRIDGERLRDRHALLHAAGQLARQLAEDRAVEADLAQFFQRDRLQLVRAAPGKALLQRQHDVFARRHPREQTVILKDHAAVQPRAADWAPVDRDPSPRRPLQPRQQAQERALAAARLSQQADELPRRHGKVDVFQYQLVLHIRKRKFFDGDILHGGRVLSEFAILWIHSYSL